MTTTLEAVQLDINATSRILTAILTAIACHESKDYDHPTLIDDDSNPGRVLSWLVQDEIVAVIAMVQKHTKFPDAEALTMASEITQLSCNFATKMMFAATKEPPQEATVQVDRLLCDLRVELDNLREAFVVPSSVDG
jgi:hypothetical protein